MKMELNEALNRLKKAGLLMESEKIDFSTLDNYLESVQRNVNETKERFQALTDELQEKLFSNIEGTPTIYILKDYPFNGFNIVYEYDEKLSICVNKNWKVSINDRKFNEIWSQKDAVQTILDNV